MKINYQEITMYVEALQNGDDTVFDYLYNLSYDHLYSLSLNILKNEHDAQDVVHECFSIIYTHIDKLEHPDQYLAWSRRIATNCALSLIRKQADIPTDNLPEIMAQNLPPIQDNLELVISSERHTALLDLICNLDSQTRDIILLKYYQGYKVKEIEGILGIKAATIKTRIHRTKKLLRQQIEKQNNKLFAIPIAFIPSSYILNHCILSNISKTNSVVKTPTVLKYTWKNSSMVSKITILALSSSVAVYGASGTNHGYNNMPEDSNNRTIVELDKLEHPRPTVDVIDYNDSILSLHISSENTDILYDEVTAIVNGIIVKPTQIDPITEILTFTIEASIIILQVPDSSGLITSYELEVFYD